jgi:hypothetical protein
VNLPVVWFRVVRRGLRSGSGDKAWWLATGTDASTMQLTTYYARRSAVECGFRDSADLHVGTGLRTIPVNSPEPRDRLWLINALAVVLSTLHGAAGEACSFDRTLKTTTLKRRVHLLFRQECMLCELVPTMPEEWLGRLKQRAPHMLREQPLVGRFRTELKNA